MVKIRVRGGVTLLIFGKNLSDLSALNVLPQISELIFSTIVRTHAPKRCARPCNSVN
jgi:hypothetical protein